MWPFKKKVSEVVKIILEKKDPEDWEIRDEWGRYNRITNKHCNIIIEDKNKGLLV